MKPQDVLVALKLLTIGDEPWTFTKLGGSLGLSVGASHNAVAHLQSAGLVFDRKNEAVLARRKLLDFLIHGVPASFYAVKRGIARGTPTAFSVPSLAGLCPGVERTVPIVWPVANGRVSGETLEPIYETVPRAAAVDSVLYEYLALVDVLRVGKSKERKAAMEILEARIMAPMRAKEPEDLSVEAAK